MKDSIMLCENCEEEPSISTTEDDVELCAECEFALINEMARHEPDCACTAGEEESGEAHRIDCEQCTCGLAGRVERRKEWLRTQMTPPDCNSWESLLASPRSDINSSQDRK